MHRLISVTELARALDARAAELAPRLLPMGHREGDEWVEARRAQGGLGDSLKVNTRRGCWKHFATGRAGDMLDLVAYVACHGSKADAIKWARDYLGLTGQAPAALQASDLAARDRASAAAEDREKWRKRALALWLEGRPLAGTPVERYLVDTRGIDIRALGRQPGALRFHPECGYYEKRGSRHELVARLPAMLGLVQTMTGEPIGVHRTYLDVSGGEVRRAAFDDAKKILGKTRGGFVMLWKGLGATGARGRPFTDLRDDPAPTIEHADNTCWVSEGIEDGLSVAVACPELRVIAAISVGNIGTISFPDAITTLGLIRQNDAPGSQAAETIEKTARGWLEQGRAVRDALPPAGVKDFNDVLRGADARAIA